MKTVVSILLMLHFVLHTLGFLLSNDLLGAVHLPLELSRWEGVCWMLAGILFAGTLVLLWADYPRWPVGAFVAVILSQVLIILAWKVAWPGTLVNGLILLLSVVYFAQQEFRLMVSAESEELSASVTSVTGVIGQDDLKELPLPVKNWLMGTGLVGKAPIQEVRLTQSLKMKLKPDQSQWSEGSAAQRIYSNPPAFHWSVDVRLNALMGFMGRDKWSDGEGYMLIKLLGLIPVVKEGPNPQINEAALQRFLAEIVWCPSLALSPELAWVPVDDHCARAIYTHGEVRGEGLFCFDDEYNFREFTALRFKETTDDAPRLPWRVSCDRTEWRSGVRIPTRCRASWEVEGKEWTWLELEVGEYERR
ncbi:DUF6544 family protein [Lewinella sp. W8]|uniref:DUF6920 family protein n=1 Tax=Lewinella sp. W8 TaxID=2528208 RepID=UPI001067768E|nr:DUF6544 family protein [Lewinella sp. W8]MTB52585.1 hypothetical protein [Lewinella sp. W8]